MVEDFSVTEIRKKLQEKGMEFNNISEEKLSERESILNNILKDVICDALYYLSQLDDEGSELQVLLGETGSRLYHGYCYPYDQVDSYITLMKILMESVFNELMNKKSFAVECKDMQPDSDYKYKCSEDFNQKIDNSKDYKCDITRVRESDSLIKIGNDQLYKEDILNKNIKEIINITLRCLPYLDKEHKFSVDSSAIWRKVDSLEDSFSPTQRQRIVEMVKLCSYNITEEIKANEPKNSITES